MKNNSKHPQVSKDSFGINFVHRGRHDRHVLIELFSEDYGTWRLEDV